MNESQVNIDGYSPRRGTKGALAVQALLDGPMSAPDLAKAIDSDKGNLNGNLAALLNHRVVIKVKDKLNRSYFALADRPLDPWFAKHGGGVVTPEIAFNPADPFGLVAAKRGASPATQEEPKATISGRKIVAPEMTAPINRAQPGHMHRAEEILASGKDSVENQGFIAGLFSTGEMTITVGSKSISLNSDHQRQLVDYLNAIRQVVA